MTYQTTMHSSTGDLSFWPTTSLHPIDVALDGVPLSFTVDAVIADLPNSANADTTPARFLVCGFHNRGTDYARITGVEVPFMELPLALRTEIVHELQRVAGVSGR